MDIAVDLGSDRTRVFIENKGIVLDEASVVAFDVDTYDIVGVGTGSTAKPVRRQTIEHMKLKLAIVISTMSIPAISPMPKSILTAFRSLVA